MPDVRKEESRERDKWRLSEIGAWREPTATKTLSRQPMLKSTPRMMVCFARFLPCKIFRQSQTVPSLQSNS